MTALLDLEQQMLIRAWIQGVPLAALDLDPDYPALAELAECRTLLHLKALRLDWPWPLVTAPSGTGLATHRIAPARSPAPP